MADLARFAARRGVPPLAHAALVYAQFDTIRPFAEGNGLTARIVVHAMLRSSGLTRRTTAPLSAGLLGAPDTHVGALAAYRNGDPETVVGLLSNATLAAVACGRRLVAELLAMRGRWHAQITARSGSGVWILVDSLFAQPVVDVRTAAALTGTSQRAAHTSIGTLARAGILTPTSSHRWGRTWQATEILRAADVSAHRAGRSG